MKHLFRDSDCRYSDDALAIDGELNAVLRPIFKKWIAKGYSPREISHIVFMASFDQELSTSLDFKEQVAGD
jgi:hypothetical protein